MHEEIGFRCSACGRSFLERPKDVNDEEGDICKSCVEWFENHPDDPIEDEIKLWRCEICETLWDLHKDTCPECGAMHSYERIKIIVW